jgi:ParB family transcriptional regulator, chromosome partitioning protein
MSKQKRLGRGLDALLVSRQRENDPPGGISTMEVPVDELKPGRYQPRRRLSNESLNELADSIREQGVLQPLVVRTIRPVAQHLRTTRYEIVAGERRWRAARIAGLTTVPVVVRELDDQSALAVALIENLQREDLNPIDQAQSLARLAGEFQLTHEQVAKAVGRSRASVSNLLRLLDLHGDVKALLAEGKIDMGHARALVPLDAKRQVAMARKVESRGLSVRQVEKAVRDLLAAPPTSASATPGVDLQTRWLQRQIGEELGQKLTIRPTKEGNYSLHIGFGDLEQLQDSLQRIQQLIGQIRDAAGPRARDANR